MANTLAPYKDAYVRKIIGQWWTKSTRTETFTTMAAMFTSYSEQCLRWLNYEEMMNIVDFQRCVYACGIVKLEASEDAALKEYVRLPKWRPSDEQVVRMRLISPMLLEHV